MSTLTQMTANVRDEILEPTAGFWSDAEIQRWLNRGAKDLARVAQIDGAPVTFDTVSGTDSYSLATISSSIGFVKRVEIETESGSGDYVKLRPGTLADATTTQGAPLVWAVWNEKLYLYPVPDAVYTMRVWSHVVQPTLTASDTPVIPVEFHSVIELYGIAMAKRKRDDPAFASYASDYQAGRQEIMRWRDRRKQQDGAYPVISEDNEHADPWGDD